MTVVARLARVEIQVTTFHLSALIYTCWTRSPEAVFPTPL